MKMRIKLFLFRLLQLTWALPQTLLGVICTLIFGGGKWFSYRGAFVRHYKSGCRVRGYLSLGLFILTDGALDEESREKVLVHEYGHCIQSLILGPFYLLLVGLPSVLWALRGKRRRGAYVSRYPENWANALGEKVTGQKGADW